eukprot:TRINITY_DN5514_c0_g1_i3.p1 TRINITY_DN5514_c0_g1~~TRINITY_DN5514_c0_g1_i3.p1  ORF type:complete len:115 (-),score=36.26 TRINITY_DN5514_c0_g1_i3:131-475(-)
MSWAEDGMDQAMEESIEEAIVLFETAEACEGHHEAQLHIYKSALSKMVLLMSDAEQCGQHHVDQLLQHKVDRAVHQIDTLTPLVQDPAPQSAVGELDDACELCLLYTSPSPRDS